MFTNLDPTSAFVDYLRNYSQGFLESLKSFLKELQKKCMNVSLVDEMAIRSVTINS